MFVFSANKILAIKRKKLISGPIIKWQTFSPTLKISNIFPCIYSTFQIERNVSHFTSIKISQRNSINICNGKIFTNHQQVITITQKFCRHFSSFSSFLQINSKLES